MSMKKFCELDKKVRESLTVKTDTYGRIIAFKINSEEEFNLVKNYLSEAHTSCMDYFPVKIEGDYAGEDWYFDETHTTDLGMGAHSTKYYVETLSEKKRKFAAFIAEYE